MKYRIAELKGSTSIAADGTTIIDIDVADPISQILIYHSVTHGADAASDGHPIKALTKVEIVDGSEVIFGMAGDCMEAIDLYENKGQLRGGWGTYANGFGTDRVIGISFGRWLWDEILALDPKQFGNLQLKITHDYTGVAGCTASANTLAVHAYLFDQKVISPVGFLMNKEVKSYAMASATEYTDLPTDFPYRKLLIQAQKMDAEPVQCVSLIKLSEDQDKRIPINNLNFADVVRGIGREGAFVKEHWMCAVKTAARNFHCTPSLNVLGTLNQWRAATAADGASFYNGDGGRFAVISTINMHYGVVVSGMAPHAVCCIPFGNQADIDDWYDVGAIGNLKLSITGITTSGTIKILTQQLRRY